VARGAARGATRGAARGAARLGVARGAARGAVDACLIRQSDRLSSSTPRATRHALHGTHANRSPHRSRIACCRSLPSRVGGSAPNNKQDAPPRAMPAAGAPLSAPPSAPRHALTARPSWTLDYHSPSPLDLAHAHAPSRRLRTRTIAAAAHTRYCGCCARICCISSCIHSRILSPSTLS